MPKNKTVSPKTKIIASRKTAANEYNGIEVLENPDRILEKLGLDQWEAYRDVLTDSQVSTVMDSRRAGVKDLEWDVVQEDSTPEITEFISENFKQLNMNQYFDEVMLANGWGMSPIEVMWKIVDGKWIVNDLIGKPSRWFQFTGENEVRFLSMKNMVEGEKIPPKKILFAYNEPSYDNPYGKSLLSLCYWPVYFKRNATKWWNTSIEKYAMPWVVMKYPHKISEDDLSALLSDLGKMVQDGILGIPADDTIEFKEPSGTRSQEIFQGLIDAADAQISKIWLGQTLTTDIGDVGSYAASKTHQGIKDERRDQDMLMITRLTNKLIRWMVDINFGTNVSAPEFIMFEPRTINKEQAERDKILKELGVKFEPKYIERIYGLEEDDFTMTEPIQEPFPPAENPSFSKELLSFASRFKDQKKIDEIIERTTKPEILQKQAEGILKPVLKLIKESNNYSEVQDKLIEQMPLMDSDSIERILEQAIFVSEAIGRFEAEKGN